MKTWSEESLKRPVGKIKDEEQWMQMKLTKHVPATLNNIGSNEQTHAKPWQCYAGANSQQHREQRANQGEAQEGCKFESPTICFSIETQRFRNCALCRSIAA